jgi:hypothetical protein
MPYGALSSDFFGLEWVMTCFVKDLFACWRGQFGSPHSKALWKMILFGLMWCIWRKSDRSFEDNEMTVVELKAFFKTLYDWMAAYDCVFIFLVFMNFLIIFIFLVRYFSCILHVYLGAPFYVLVNFKYLSLKSSVLLETGLVISVFKC